MALILATTQTNTPDDDVLGDDWEGGVAFVCTAYGTAVAKIEFQHPEPGNDEWIPIKNGTDDVQLQSKGDTQYATLIKDLKYRAQTATAGAEVYVFKQDVRA